MNKEAIARGGLAPELRPVYDAWFNAAEVVLTKLLLDREAIVRIK